MKYQTAYARLQIRLDSIQQEFCLFFKRWISRKFELIITKKPNVTWYQPRDPRVSSVASGGAQQQLIQLHSLTPDTLTGKKKKKRPRYHLTLHCATPFTSEGLNAAPRTRAQARSRGLGSISKVRMSPVWSRVWTPSERWRRPAAL